MVNEEPRSLADLLIEDIGVKNINKSLGKIIGDFKVKLLSYKEAHKLSKEETYFLGLEVANKISATPYSFSFLAGKMRFPFRLVLSSK